MGAGETITITTAALLAGVIAWFALAWWHRRKPLDVRPLFLLVVVCGMVCRLVYVFLTPIFYAPDEQSHFNYVRHLVENKTFPVLTSPTPTPANEWENHQPPLYYLLLVPVYLVGKSCFDGPAPVVFGLRCCSVLLWLLNVWFATKLLRRMQLEDRFVPVFVLSLVCLLPTYVFVSSAINNDNLLVTIATAVLCLVAERKYTPKLALGLGLLLGLALLAKQSALVLIPAVVILPLLDCLGRKLAWPRMLSYLGLLLGIAVLVYSPWAMRNWTVYGWLSPEHMSPAQKSWPGIVYGVASASHNLLKTFWSVSGISNDVGYPFPLVGMLLLGLCFATTQMRENGHRNIDALKLSVNGPLMTAFSCAALVNVLLVLRFGYLFGMGQGRHLFALLIPLALLLAAGLRRLPVKHLEIHAVGYWVTYALAFEAFGLCRFPR